MPDVALGQPVNAKNENMLEHKNSCPEPQVLKNAVGVQKHAGANHGKGVEAKVAPGKQVRVSYSRPKNGVEYFQSVP